MFHLLRIALFLVTLCLPGVGLAQLTPLLQPSPSSISLSTTVGGTTSGSFNLQKSSTEQSSYLISTNQAWIWLDPPYGSTQTITTEIDKITVTIDPSESSQLSVGTYSGVVYIVESGPNGSQTLRIPVTLTITSGTVTPPPPTPPTPPTNSLQATVTWDAPQYTDGYNLYRILKSCKTVTATTDWGAPVAPSILSTTYVDKSIPLNTRSVCYAVSAYNVKGESPLSIPAGISFNVAPSAPSTPNFH